MRKGRLPPRISGQLMDGGGVSPEEFHFVDQGVFQGLLTAKDRVGQVARNIGSAGSNSGL